MRQRGRLFQRSNEYARLHSAIPTIRTHMRLTLIPYLIVATTVVLAAAPVPGTAGNGIIDDTAALQRAIDSLPAYGVLDGGGATYLTGTLRLKSRMTMQNFFRSEERRVGKECRSRWSPYH